MPEVITNLTEFIVSLSKEINTSELIYNNSRIDTNSDTLYLHFVYADTSEILACLSIAYVQRHNFNAKEFSRII